jgi:hypothetical protein
VVLWVITGVTSRFLAAFRRKLFLLSSRYKIGSWELQVPLKRLLRIYVAILWITTLIFFIKMK